MSYSAKRLNRDNLDKIHEVEKKLGYCVVAWEKTPKVANLTEPQLSELKSLEQEMGAILVAYDCK